jgi:NADH-quinone oxidoreductase subunit L
MTTHAFFKALLFLGAGSVIHAMSGEQDIRLMGGLRKYLPITFSTFLIGTLAISGIPPFAGFFSKDEILAHAFEHNQVIWAVALIASLLTSFYMFRLFFLTFSNTTRASQEVVSHIHESPASMTIALIALAILSAIGGFMGIPEVFGGHHMLSTYLAPVFEGSKGLLAEHQLSHSTEFMLMGVVITLTLVMILIAYFIYVRSKKLPAQDEASLSPVQRLVYNKYYIDELYAAVVTKPLNGLSKVLDAVIEKLFIDRIVNGTGRVVTWGGKTLRLVQTGNTGFYIFAMVISVIVILVVKSLIKI